VSGIRTARAGAAECAPWPARARRETAFTAALLSARVSATAGSGSVQLECAAAPRSVPTVTVTGSGSGEVVVPRGRRYRVGGPPDPAAAPSGRDWRIPARPAC